MPPRFQLRPIAAGLCLALALLLLFAWAALLAASFTPQPALIEEQFGQAVVHLESANVRVLTETGCIPVRWAAEGIQTIRLNNTPTIGVGESEVCAANARLTVTLTDGATETVRLEPEVVMGSGLLWQMPALAAGLIAGALYLLRYQRRPTPAHVGSPDSARQRTASAAIVVALVLIGAAARLAFMDTPIRGDEAWTVTEYSSRPLHEALSRYESTNNHLLHTLVQHVSLRVFGSELIWLRLPAFMAGLLAIAAAYRAGTDLYNRRAGLLTAVFVAAAAPMIEFSVNARGYSLLILLVLLLLSVSQRAIRTNRLRLWAAFAVLSALGFYAQPIMLYPFGMIVVWVALNLFATYESVQLQRRLYGFAASVVAAGVLTLVLYVPVILFLLTSGTDSLDTDSLELGGPLLSFASRLAGYLVGGMRDLTGDMPDVVLAVMSAAFVVALVWHRRSAKLPVSLALAALIWLTPLHYVQRAVFISRSYVSLLPLLAMMASAGLVLAVDRLIPLAAARARLTVIAGVALLVALLAGASAASWPGLSYDVVPSGEEAAEYLVAHVDTFDAVLCRNPCFNVLRFYLPKIGTPEAQQALAKLYLDHEVMPLVERLLVLVTIPGEDVGMVEDRVDVDTDLYQSPEQLATLEEGAVWLYRRLPG